MEDNKENATYTPIPEERAPTDNLQESTDPAGQPLPRIIPKMGNKRKTTKTKSVSKETGYKPPPTICHECSTFIKNKEEVKFLCEFLDHKLCLDCYK